MQTNITSSRYRNVVVLDFESRRRRFLPGQRSHLDSDTSDNGVTVVIPFHNNHNAELVPHGDDAA